MIHHIYIKVYCRAKRCPANALLFLVILYYTYCNTNNNRINNNINLKT